MSSPELSGAPAGAPTLGSLTPRASTSGVIHDIGYQRYAGVRLGRRYATRSLYAHGVRTAFGLGRSAKAKIFPWLVVALLMLVATIITAVRSMQGEMVLGYTAFSDFVSLLTVLFCAIAGPELVSRDLRTGVLPLYFSRPLARSDYALAKWASLVTATWLLLAAPLTLVFVGGAFTVDGMGKVWDEFLLFLAGLGYAGVHAVLFASIAILVASLAGRRAVAAAIIAAFFLLSTAVFGIMYSIAVATENKTLTELALLFSPQTLAQGVELWLFNPREQDLGEVSIGTFGPVYGLAWLGLIAVSVLLLLVRYKKVAR